jgi:hypothetical protein
MISKLFGAVFTPKYPRRYTGRHRAGYLPQRRAEAAATTPDTVVALEATA